MNRTLKRVSVMLSVLMTVMLFFAAPLHLSADAADASSKAGIVNTSSSRLNVRSSASTSSAVKTSLSKGSYVTLISKSGNWWYVQYSASGYGYCSASYIKEVSGSYAAYVNTNSSRLNIRSGASTSYSVKTSLAKGTAVVVIGESGSFYKVLYNGKNTGYASKSYIKAYSSSATSSVSLSVPKYYQTDSRWKNVKLGSSGKTIEDIGCTVTCLAMTESYRTGTTVTPATMASRLTFTSGGALYWPSNYNLSTSGNTYTQIYNVLKSGRPVIYGSRTSSGGSHWVVVTGFKGGSLSAANFTVNDPATSKTTTLSQHIAKYPNFIRIAYAD